MDKWLLHKIPKIANFYWGGTTLPYARYASIFSFQKFNTDWEIRFFYPTQLSSTTSWKTFEQKYELEVTDYFPKLKKLGITMVPINFNNIGIDNSISEVHKSDFLRWWILSTIGGLWSDMDIIYYKSMTNILFNKEEFKNIDTGVSICEYGHSIGFMLASANNHYYSYMWNKSKSAWNAHNYQCIGSVLSNNCFPTLKSIKDFFSYLNPINIPTETVYAYNANHIKEIYETSDMSKFTPSSIGLHWYAGHLLAGEFLNKTNGGLIPHNSVIGKVLKYLIGKPFFQIINELVEPNDKVLDVGCGDKERIKNLNGVHTTLDIWEPFKPNVLWDLNKLPLPFKDNEFDVTYLIDVIEHLEKEKGKLLLEEVKRVTKNKIIVFTPLWWTDNSYYMNDKNSSYYGNPYEKHQSLWTKEDFKDWKEIEADFIGNYYLGMWEKK